MLKIVHLLLPAPAGRGLQQLFWSKGRKSEGDWVTGQGANIGIAMVTLEWLEEDKPPQPKRIRWLLEYAQDRNQLTRDPPDREQDNNPVV